MSDSSKAVFLSYASQDSEAAKKICDALRAAGVEVWFDQSELVGGDAWDQKIRRQIKECALFVPIISTNTQARREGYFRLEWRLADQRTHLMAKGLPFLLPVVIDATRDAEAHVPDSFTEVQWTRGCGGGELEGFAHRVGKLLAAGADETRASSPSAPPAVRAPAPVRRKWLGPVLLGAAVMAFLLVATAWQRTSSRGANGVTKSTTGTEAQQLVAKARAIYEEGDEVNRQTYALAEQLLIKAEAIDVAEPSAWALHAEVSADQLGLSIDRSAARRDALRTQAERAASLAPGSLDAELAQAYMHYAFDQYDAATKRLETLAEKYPRNIRVWRWLSRTYLRAGTTAQVRMAIEKWLQLRPDDPSAKSTLVNALLADARYADAEAALTAALQGRTSARLLTFDVQLALVWSGEIQAALARSRDWPSWLFLEDRGVAHVAIAALWARQPAQALDVLGRFPRDYVREFLYTGPRAVLSAWAHEQAGHTEAAQADWRIAAQVADRELSVMPDDGPALHWKALALARLGETGRATLLFQQLQERRPPVQNLQQLAGGFAALALALGRPEDAIAELALIQPDRAKNIRSLTKTVLQLNPLFDPLRQHPRFHELLAAAPGPAAQGAEGGGLRTDKSGTFPVDSKSVAVLAFANLSDDKDNEYFSDGISEELLNVLAKVPGLKVSARTSAFSFKGKGVAIPEIARQLGVAYVIEGSVRKAGNRVRITAQLIKAADGFHVWSDNFDRELKDIFAVQDEIAGLIARNLSLTLAGGGQRHEGNAEAMRLYFEGRQLWSLRSPAALRRAEELFRQSVAIDPAFARGYAGLADVLYVRRSNNDNVLGRFGRRNSRETEIETLVEKALALDPSLPDAVTTLAAVHALSWRPEEAIRQFQRALELNPNYATAHQWLGRCLLADGRLTEAVDSLRRAAELDPLSPIILDNLAVALCIAGRPAEGLAAADRSLILRPDVDTTLIWRAFALLKIGRKDEALALIPQLRRHVTEAMASGECTSIEVLLRCIIARVWHETGVLAELRNLRAESAARDPVAGFFAAAMAGVGAEALPLPTLANFHRFSVDSLWLPELDYLRADPKFAAMIEQLGLTAAQERVLAYRRTANHANERK